MARTDRGPAKAYLREPIAVLELSHLVRDLPIVKWTREIQKTDHKVHYSAESVMLAVMCDKVGRDGSECPGVECVLEWGISDKEGHKIRKETRASFTSRLTMIGMSSRRIGSKR